MLVCKIRPLEKKWALSAPSVVIFTYTNAGYSDYVINLARSLSAVNDRHKLIVFCLDTDAVSILAPIENIVTVPFFENVSLNSESYNTPAYKQIVYRKLDIICSLLSEKFENIKYFFYLDSDVVLLKDPIDYLLNYIEGKEVVFQCGEHGPSCSGACTNKCTGVIFFKNDTKLIDFFKYENVQPEMDGDQDYLNSLYRNSGPVPDTKILPVNLFPNGSNLSMDLKDSYLFHYNYMVLNEKKPMMIAKGHWFFSMTFPDNYRPRILVNYPPDATDLIEEYFYRYYKPRKDWTYIDIFWTNLYVNQDQFGMPMSHQFGMPMSHQFGMPMSHQFGMPMSHQFGMTRILGNLAQHKNYFTLVQHDDCVREKLPVSTVVFSSGSAKGDICIPLNYLDRNDTFSSWRNKKKDIFCSFIGSNTHSVRNKMIKELIKFPDIVLHMDNWSNQVTEKRKNLFLDTTSRSVFSLCPRGYGPTSFRLYQALDLGSVPVYVWEGDEWLPFRDIIDYNKLIVSIHVNELPTLYEKLKTINPEEMLKYYETIKHHFTLEGTVKRIENALSGKWGLEEIIRNRLRNSKDTLYLEIEEVGFGAMISRLMTGLGIALHYRKKMEVVMTGCKYLFPFETEGFVLNKEKKALPKFNFDYTEGSFEWKFMDYWNGDRIIRKNHQYPVCPFNPNVDQHRWCAHLLSFLIQNPVKELKELVEKTKERIGWANHKRRIGLHVRRGDKHIENAPVPEEVYLKYVQEILTPDSVIFLTSDDPSIFDSFTKLVNVPILWDREELRYNNDNKTVLTEEAKIIQESYTAAKNILLLGDCDYVIGNHNAQFTWLGGLLSVAKNDFDTSRHIMIHSTTHQRSHWSVDY